ncbi:hypothetical protein [Ancylobacter mangrovi]|uniref:hypothetical protein n=1 Tax=Ancylobacter mangrovi TaxID=2972472 RepID=UPI00216314B7|nr:hypothetical protein [Ancylobacter mangrovi]MCS0501399.1 hypothetical protein [Ancylobacter mangrovi]
MPTTVLAGTGWLRTTYADSPANYEIELHTAAGGRELPSADGTLSADVALMIEARSRGSATLVLETERVLRIRILDASQMGLAFRVIDVDRLLLETGQR